jgi:signal peptidase I
MLFLKWFTSRSVRHAWQAANHVEKILHHQRDLLAPQAIEAVQAGVSDLRATCRNGDKGAVRVSLGKLEIIANENLKPYPNAAWRENIEVALVAIAVAMAVRTFFLQPFKIPTGSMQPTLYGITDESYAGRADVKFPNAVQGFMEYWFRGVSYQHVVAKTAGQLTDAKDPKKLVLFNLWQDIVVGGTSYRVWFPPDGLLRRAGLVDGCGQGTRRVFQPGDDIIKLRSISGDHLFVDRVTYNFRPPARGDIVVFETHKLFALPRDQQDTYYIKRLVGLGGDTLEIKRDALVTGVPGNRLDENCNLRLDDMPAGHLVVNGRELSAATPRFENLYSFPHLARGATSMAYRTNHYHGHGQLGFLAEGRKYEVPREHYFVMGDNTYNSSDSRMWGDFEKEKVIGKSFFVYWPIGGTTFNGEERPSRFGWAHR